MLLYMCAFAYSLGNEDIRSARNALSGIERTMSADASGGECEEAVELLLNVSMETGETGLVPQIKRIAALLPAMGDRLRNDLTKAGDLADADALSDQGLGAVFHDLFVTLLKEDKDEEDRRELAAMEIEILAKLDVYRPQIDRIKKSIPAYISCTRRSSRRRWPPPIPKSWRCAA